MFCENCGKQIKDDARFCPFCGAPVNPDPGAAAPAAPVRSMPATAAPAAAAAMAGGVQAPAIPNAEAVTYRTKCPNCGNAQDSRYIDNCKQCGTQHQVDTAGNGFLQIYRMGHFSGSMAGEAIYLNGEGMGHVGNASQVIIELPPGSYNLHMAIGVCRNCEDIMVDIEPGKVVCVKSQLKMGAIKNKILLHRVDPSEMPPLA